MFETKRHNVGFSQNCQKEELRQIFFMFTFLGVGLMNGCKEQLDLNFGM